MNDFADDPDEETAELECAMIDAARALVDEHGYTRADIEGILAGTIFGTNKRSRQT